MDLFVLMAQRKERYEGQYGFEALACMSEAGQEENTEYLQEALAENRATGEFEAIAIVKLEMRGSDIRAALYPANKAIAAKVHL